MKRTKRLFAVVMSLALVFTMMFATVSVDAATKAKKITLKASNSTVYVGKYTSTVSVKSVSPKKASKAVTYSSSDKTIATVTSKGVVKGIAPGEVTIKAVSKTNKKVTASIKLNVKDPATQHEYIGPEKLYASLTSYTVLDVRANDVKDLDKDGDTVEDAYDACHIPSAIKAPCNVAGDEATIKAAVTKYGKGNYALVCHTGNKFANRAAELLIANGVDPRRIFILSDKNGERSDNGGMAAWTATYPAMTVVSAKASASEYVYANAIDEAGLKANLKNEKYVIVDVRDAASFKKSHIDGAVSYPLATLVDGKKTELPDKTKASAMNSLVKKYPNSVYVVICYSGNNYVQAAIKTLNGIGAKYADRVVALTCGNNGWKDAETQIPTINYISAKALYNSLGKGTYTVLDVRTVDRTDVDGDGDKTEPAYGAAHVPTSVAVPVKDADVDGEENVKDAVERYGKDGKYALVCYSGNAYAKAATKLLIANGVNQDNIYTVTGGIGEWTKSYSNYLVKSYKSIGGFDYMNGVTAEQIRTDLAKDKKYVVVDVRSADAYKAGHITGAVSYPVDAVDEATAEANMAALIKKYPNAMYAVVCYTGNKNVNIARNALAKLGVDERQVMSVEYGFGRSTDAQGARYVCNSTFGSVTTNPLKKTLSFKATVNGKMLKKSTMHYILNKSGAMASQALMTTSATTEQVSEALKSLKATAWDTKYVPEMGDGFTTVKAQAAKGIGNSSYSHLKITVGGKDMAKTLKNYKSPDSVFANVFNKDTNAKTGCIVCNTSCYFGVVADNNKTIGKGFVANTANLPKAGKSATVVITVK